jgi:hypothetical protein
VGEIDEAGKTALKIPLGTIAPEIIIGLRQWKVQGHVSSVLFLRET